MNYDVPHQRLRDLTDAADELPPPRVSVVIPCFNYGRFLGEAVGSVLSQEGVDVDVIIVDDASTDDSVDVARSLAQASPRVRVLQHAVNRGPVATFNQRFGAGRREFLGATRCGRPAHSWIAVALGDGDVSVPLSGFVYGHPRHFRGTPPPPVHSPRAVVVRPGLEWLEQLRPMGVTTSPEAFMRMSVVDLVGGQRSLAHTHDMEMWMRLAACSDVGYVAGIDQAWHREHLASLSLTAEDSGGVAILKERRSLPARPRSRESSARCRSPVAENRGNRALAEEALGRICYDLDRRRADPTTVEALLEFAAETFGEADRLPLGAGCTSVLLGVRSGSLPIRGCACAQSIE